MKKNYLKKALVIGILGTSLFTQPIVVNAEEAAATTQNGWVSKDGSWYYYKDGVMQTDTWIDDNYVDSNGVWLTNYKPAKWMQTNGKWWYRNADGSYPVNSWKQIESKWYYFDGSGYMVTGWKKIGTSWYYFDGSGVMKANSWVISNGKYYYMGADGIMQTNTWIGNYYVDANGIWQKDYQPAKWVQTNGKWWYRNADGSYPVNSWKQIEDEWYYFDGSGYRVTGWKKIGKAKYYFNEDGTMLSGGRWVIDGVDYCFNDSGSMHTGWYKEINLWADDNSECVDWLYFNEDGTLHTKWLKLNGKTYWTGDYGYLVCSYPDRGASIALRCIDGHFYGFDENGVMLTGHQQSVNNKTGEVTDYYFDDQGREKYLSSFE